MVEQLYAPTQYGNELVLSGAQAQDSKTLLDTYGAPGVDADKSRNLPGAWVLSLRTLDVVAGTGLQFEVNPAIARIGFGSGGKLMQVDVNVYPDAVIQLPSATCRVDLRWDQLPEGYFRPASVRVAAILQRTNATQSRARRLTFLSRAISTAAAPELDIAIPAYARAVRPWGDPGTSIGYSSDLIWSFLTRGGVSKFGATGAGGALTGQQLAAQAMQGREYVLPSGISAVQGTIQGTASFGAFPILLTDVWALDWRIEL